MRPPLTDGTPDSGNAVDRARCVAGPGGGSPASVAPVLQRQASQVRPDPAAATGPFAERLVAAQTVATQAIGGNPSALGLRTIPVLCAADQRYAMPLAVTLVSAAMHLRPGTSLQVWLVDGGLSEEGLGRLRESLAGLPVELMLVSPSGVDLGDLGVSHHISHTAYLRLLADRWLPPELDSALYLDSDLVVRAPLDELWDLPMGDHCLMAVQDIACPWVDARVGGVNFRRSCPWMATWRPVPNYREHGLSGREPYFNSGVMVLNLAAWREQRLGEQLLECLRIHRQHVWCWDQYALNCVLADRWRRLPARWNVGAHAWEYPSADQAPIERLEFEEMLERPAIVHYTTEWKPWDFGTRHPLRELFFQHLDLTAWRGWRPQRPPFRWQRHWQSFAVGVTKQFTIQSRRLRSLGFPAEGGR